jgi:hypothetical protein
MGIAEFIIGPAEGRALDPSYALPHALSIPIAMRSHYVGSSS